MTMVKMCGLHRTEDADYANEASPDMAGVIMAPGFRRSVSDELAKSIVDRLSYSISSVGVFMDQPLEYVIQSEDVFGFAVIQLHGREDDSYIERIKDSCGIPVIKRFGTDPESLEAARDSAADYVLIDPGNGSGETFDLSVLKGIGRKIIIAGGLTPENVAYAIHTVRPYGVDTSSGIETEGSKDREKMIRFISAVRAEDKREEEMK